MKKKMRDTLSTRIQPDPFWMSTKLKSSWTIPLDDNSIRHVLQELKVIPDE